LTPRGGIVDLLTGELFDQLLPARRTDNRGAKRVEALLMSATAPRFDVIVIGAGPAGETAASRLNDQGLRTALVEQELIGGECAYWACIPSKTLLTPGELASAARRNPGTTTPSLVWEEIAAYRDYMIRDLDDSGEEQSYADKGVTVVRGAGRLDGPGRVRVGDELLQADRILIATGSETNVPPIDGLEQAGFWTNREATTLKTVPDSVAVLGGGPVGIELAQMLRRFGAEVTLVERGDRLLAREDERVSELLLEALRADGIDVQTGAEVSRVIAGDGYRTIELGQQRAPIRARELIVATSRRPRIDGLGLESAGIEPGAKGIEVDARCRAAEGIWAIGDVTGSMAFTHVAMYQGRLACADIAGEQVQADYRAIPRVVFCDPEVAAVGVTRARAFEQGIEVDCVEVKLADQISRPWTLERDPRGELAVIVDRRRRVVIGAWAVSPLASEWIHYAALAVKAQIPIATLKDTAAQFPTFTEAYLKALEQLPR
jgi:pyruvate/2-oxoglutarate dehydrogenase complex dihydrolipoamide dehydrogenase (E3) component